MDHKFSISLMCMDFLEIKKQIKILDKYADFLHVDIMDGHFVKNFALSPAFIAQIRPITKLSIDVHLLVDNPEDYIEMFSQAGANYITFFPESIKENSQNVIESILSAHCKVGVSLKPSTSVEIIKDYICLLDKVTIMTVDPGFIGQPFLDETLNKIKILSEWKKQFKYKYEIEADGAGRKNTFKRLISAGTEVFVVGTSGLFSLNKDLNKAWDIMIKGFSEEIKQ